MKLLYEIFVKIMKYINRASLNAKVSPKTLYYYQTVIEFLARISYLSKTW